MRLVQPVNTLLLDANDPADLLRAAELLAAGQLVAVPTETVYGLAADARNPQAVEEFSRPRAGLPAIP